ncbi:hypothetical protein EXN66_Car017260 [Channa argus]|uniref:Uncharacterized protein n=1 Tax=Channa argus TaxID=215402 RepID=A0A6G1QG90_CHAAH|nr:hypothetical protein EXN66_Car017260 [Channa argus]
MISTPAASHASARSSLLLSTFCPWRRSRGKHFCDYLDHHDASSMKCSRFTFGKALDIPYPPYLEGERDAGQNSDSAPSIASSLPGSPLFPLEDMEYEGEQEAPSAQRQRKSIPLPPEPPSPAPNQMVGDIYRGEHKTKCLTLWPSFPALRPFFSEARQHPGKLRFSTARIQSSLHFVPKSSIKLQWK